MLRRLAVSAVLMASLSQAALVRIEVKERSDAFTGYERVIGRAFFAVDPSLPANRIIVDIDKAPRNAEGQVEFSSDIYILKPKDPRAGNGSVLFEVSNRGGKGMLGIFNRAGGSTDPRNERDFGDGFLFEQGYTLVWLGWQFDVPEQPNLMRLYAPVAKGVKGLVRAEITVDSKELSHSVADRNHRPYPVLNPDDAALKLTVRDRVEGERRTVPRALWHVEDGARIVMKEGFEPGRIYELVYTAQDPPVAGAGMAAMRDTISFLKYGGAKDEVLGDQNRYLKRAFAFGVSQSGRFLRTYLYNGFNQDERNRKAFDGIMAHVGGAGRGSFNVRFAQPSRDGHPFLNTLYPTDIFPFTDLDETDAGLTDGLLTHAMKPRDWPKVFYTNSSYEYYGRDASLIHTSIDGKKDAPLPSTTRIYFFAGGQHGPAAFPPPQNHTQNMSNPDPYTWSLRALLVAMNHWVKDGAEPPASQYPKVAADQAVPLGAVQFPKIPGVAFPTRTQRAWHADYGPQFRAEGVITQEPPKLGAPFPLLFPQVDRDGNEVAGVRMPEIQAPLATYTGWNLRAPDIGAPDELFSMQGSWIPFPRTQTERMKTGDPRLSMDERYASREEYLAKFEAAAKSLAAGGYLLAADVPKLVLRGGAEWDYLHR
jgi:Alpha/beta hydrolase domain